MERWRHAARTLLLIALARVALLFATSALNVPTGRVTCQ